MSGCGKLLSNHAPVRVTTSRDPFADIAHGTTHQARAALAAAHNTAASTSAIAGIRYIA
jgi:hypothetical protein